MTTAMRRSIFRGAFFGRHHQHCGGRRHRFGRSGHRTRLEQSGRDSLVTSSMGAITDPDSPAGGADVTALNVALSAATGIGTAANPVYLNTTNLVATNSTSGGIFVLNTGTLNVGWATNPFSGIQDFSPGDTVNITVPATFYITNTLACEFIQSNNGPIILTAYDMSLLKPVNAGTVSSGCWSSKRPPMSSICMPYSPTPASWGSATAQNQQCHGEHPANRRHIQRRPAEYGRRQRHRSISVASAAALPTISLFTTGQSTKN